MSVRLLAALSLLIVPLSGCLAGIGTMSAENGLATALAHADELVDGDEVPVLMAIASIEPLSHYYDEEDDFEVNIYADSVQGDGKAPGWAYGFCVGDDAVFILMAAGMGVLGDARDGGECQQEDIDEWALGDWSIDSDEAASILNDHPDWPEAREDSISFWVLNQWPSNYAEEDGFEPAPYWEVEVETFDGWAYAAVNAQTGEVVFIESDTYPEEPDMAFVEVEAAEPACVETTIDDSDASAITVVRGLSVSITLPAEGTVELVAEAFDLLADTEYTLEGPEGVVSEGKVTDYTYYLKGGLPEGEYTLEVDTGSYSEVDVSLTGYYCG